jgi:hypothetical protein
MGDSIEQLLEGVPEVFQAVRPVQVRTIDVKSLPVCNEGPFQAQLDRMTVGIERRKCQLPSEQRIGECRIDQQLAGPHETGLQEDRALPSIHGELGLVLSLGRLAKWFVAPPRPPERSVKQISEWVFIHAAEASGRNGTPPGAGPCGP